jgi:hypothetical protein
LPISMRSSQRRVPAARCCCGPTKAPICKASRFRSLPAGRRAPT